MSELAEIHAFLHEIRDALRAQTSSQPCKAPDKLAYTVEEAATAVGVSKSTIDRAINAGKLPVKRTSINDVGEPAGSRLIRRSDLEAWLDGLVDG